jgi:hypothetical protein
MPDSHGFVNSATVKNGYITFIVKSDYFEAGEYVEISGNATQEGGAFADIHAIAQVSAPASGVSDKPYVDVTAESLSQQGFSDQEAITVFIQVAYVWVTVLGPGTGVTGGTQQPGTWADVRKVSEIGGQPYIPTPGG